MLDASAVIPLIRRLQTDIVEYIDQFVILDLTIYEIGNAFWKRYYLKNTEQGKQDKKIEKVLKEFSTILESIEVYRIKPSDFTGIFRIASEHGLTFYDASYVYIAEKHKFQLITEDREILKKFRKAISLEEALKEIKG